MLRAQATLDFEGDDPRSQAVAAQPLPAAPAPPVGFDAVYDECFDFVWRTVRRLGVAEESVDDVTQEVFFAVHRKLPDFAGRSSLRTWLFSIVLHVVRHHRRSWRRKDAQRAPAEATTIDELPDRRSQGPLQAAETADNVRLLDRLLRELDDDKREVFVLAHLEQMTAPEIAEVIGENVNTVYSRLRAARDQFEQALERQRARDAWRRR
jgi:RNA polymerase sigma-70 factor (ECF subfamily)